MIVCNTFAAQSSLDYPSRYDVYEINLKRQHRQKSITTNITIELSVSAR